MERMRSPRSVVFAGLALAVLIFASGCAMIPPPRALWNLTRSAPPPGAERAAFNLSVYENVWNWIDARYYNASFNGADWPAARERHRAAAVAAKNDQELYAAINAMLEELDDRHTRAQPAPEFARSFRQLNVVLGFRAQDVPDATDGRRKVIEVIAKSPAAQAGVGVGWILLACNGRPPAEVIGPGKLQEGAVVRCDFLTETGEARTLVITAKQMVVPTYRLVREVAEGVFLLRFDGFDFPSARWVREQVKAHAEAKALIFDLRGNPGGHVFALSSILGDVFPHSVDLGGMVHRGRIARWHRFIFQHGGVRYGGKIAVLVSARTTSAGEVFSQLVQDYHRGPVVGQKTGGALLTSVFWPLAGGGKLWMSVYDYRSPKGTRVEGRGVLPDIEVPVSAAALAPDDDNDPEVKAALRALQAGGGERAP